MTLPLQCLEASRLSHFWQFVRKTYFCSKSLRMVQFVKISVFSDFHFFPAHWVTRLPDLVIFCRFSKIKTWSIFSALADWICHILHIMIVLIPIHHLTSIDYLAGWHVSLLNRRVQPEQDSGPAGPDWSYSEPKGSAWTGFRSQKSRRSRQSHLKPEVETSPARTLQFSTLVELESENVRVCVCPSPLFIILPVVGFCRNLVRR